VNDGSPPTGLPQTVTVQLGTLGALVADRFAKQIEAYGLKPKHVALLIALSHGVAASQQELAGKLAVVPSLVVALADRLEQCGAITRVRDPTDRRRQVLALTGEGARLLARCETAARAIDDELLAALSAPERAALRHALRVLAEQADPKTSLH